MSTQRSDYMQDPPDLSAESPEHSQAVCQGSFCESVESTVRSKPLTSMMTVFGLGIGAGALVGYYLLAGRCGESAHTAQSLSARLKKSLSGVVPEWFQHDSRG